MSSLTLDISKSSMGWALWAEGWAAPRYAAVQLGSEFTSDGRTCLKLHKVLSDLHEVEPFEHLYFEKPLTQMERGGASNPSNDILLKLVGHAESWGEAYGLRTVMPVNISSWRRHFIGKMPRGTKTKQWKDYARERCRSYGWSPRTTDEADALGMMDYCIGLQGLTPPWRAEEVLFAPLGIAR
jgi:hypothetical protein